LYSPASTEHSICTKSSSHEESEEPSRPEPPPYHSPYHSPYPPELARLFERCTKDNGDDGEPLVAVEPFGEEGLVQETREHDPQLHQHVVRAGVKGGQVHVHEVIVHGIEQGRGGVLDEQRGCPCNVADERERTALEAHVQTDRQAQLDRLGEQHHRHRIVVRRIRQLGAVDQQVRGDPERNVAAKDGPLQCAVKAKHHGPATEPTAQESKNSFGCQVVRFLKVARGAVYRPIS